MSSLSSLLRCNRCWKPLVDEFAWVTACSHIFCDDDANKYFSRQSTCPCCNSSVNRETELKRVRPELEESPPMVLWGQTPALILEACASALGFFMYQKKQEIAWMNHIISQKDKQQQTIQATAQQQIQERNDHIKHLNEKISSCMEELQKKDNAFAELRKAHKETTRICKNYEKLYNQMKAVKNRSNLKESPSTIPNPGAIAHIGSNRDLIGATNYIECSMDDDDPMPKTIPEVQASSSLPTDQQCMFEAQFEKANKLLVKTSLPSFLGKPPRPSRSVDSFTPKPMKTLNALGKGMLRSNKDVVHPLNKHSPHTMMRLTSTPGAATTPMSTGIFQSMRPSLYSRFSIKRRK